MSITENSQATAIIAKQLRKFRKNANLSQQQLGDVLGLSNQQYSKFESGINRIYASQILIIANMYSVDANQFFHDVEFTDNMTK